MKQTISLELRLADVEIEIACLPETLEVRGNALASGVDDEDRACEDKIIADLENGNEWAWCCVRVTAKLGPFVGTDYLGGCSYDSESQFREPGGYFNDMRQGAIDDMIEQAKAAGAVVR